VTGSRWNPLHRARPLRALMGGVMVENLQAERILAGDDLIEHRPAAPGIDNSDVLLVEAAAGSPLPRTSPMLNQHIADEAPGAPVRSLGFQTILSFPERRQPDRRSCAGAGPWATRSVLRAGVMTKRCEETQ